MTWTSIWSYNYSPYNKLKRISQVFNRTQQPTLVANILYHPTKKHIVQIVGTGVNCGGGWDVNVSTQTWSLSFENNIFQLIHLRDTLFVNAVLMFLVLRWTSTTFTFHKMFMKFDESLMHSWIKVKNRKVVFQSFRWLI